MVDGITLLRAARLGFEFVSDENDNYWYRKEGDKENQFGPYNSMDSAAHAAINQYENQLAFSFLEKYNGVQ